MLFYGDLIWLIWNNNGISIIPTTILWNILVPDGPQLAMENLKAIDGVNIDGPWYLGNLFGYRSFRVLHTACFFTYSIHIYVYGIHIYIYIYKYAHQITANTHTYIYTYTFTHISSMYTYMYMVIYIYIYICAFAGEPLYKTCPFKVFQAPYVCPTHHCRGWDIEGHPVEVLPEAVQGS